MIKIYESVTVRNNMTLRLKCGLATVKFEFERGNVAKGIRARYITDDPFKQRVLDINSSNGKLYRLAKTIKQESDDVVEEVNEKSELKAKAEAAAKAAYEAIMNGMQAKAPEDTDTKEEQDGTTEGAAEDAEAPAAEENKPKGTTMKDVEFADAAEAAAKAAYEAIMNGMQSEVPEATDTEEEQGGTTEGAAEDAEAPAAEETKSKGTTMKDVEFADAAEAIVYVMQNYGEQVESLEAATKVLRKHKINPVIK